MAIGVIIMEYPYVYRLYIFNYGAPIAIIQFESSENRVTVFTKFTDSGLIEGMAIVASLIKKFHDRKMFVVKDYVGYMGKKYIVIGMPIKPIFSPSILGFLRKLALKLDSIGDAPVQIIARLAIREILGNKSNKYRIVFK